MKALAAAWRGIASAFATPSAATLFFLGFGCGLPFLLVGYTLSIWLREAQYDLGAIGLISYATLFYVFKFVWAPLLDRFSVPLFGRLGRRRGWMLLSQALLAAALLAMAATGPQASITVFVALVGLVALAGATQDTVVDAYRIEIAPIEAQAALAATYTLGYRLALIASGAGALYLADLAGWAAAYMLMAALMLLPLVAVLLAREPHLAPPLQRGLAETFVGPFREFFGRNGVLLALALLAFVGLFKMPDQMLGVVAGPFYVDSGFDKSQIATVSKLIGVWVGIAGTFLGGVAVAGFGLRGPLVVAAVAVSVSNLLFVLMTQHPGELWVFVLTICGDNLAQGFAGTVLVAFMSSLADRNYTATQYALLSSLANLPGKLLGGASGWMAEAWGYAGFFVLSTVSVVPTLLLLAWLWPRTRLQGHGH
ncbi:MAG: AmpG family muropeptide MFS transporter [Rhodocyclaceae bacterium]|nr:AmpG family muropeptide MFS transporter [Rhodocyclaceae bacterium]